METRRAVFRVTAVLVIALAAVVAGSGGGQGVAADSPPRWRVVASRNTTHAANWLSRVSCPDATHCVAIGGAGGQGATSGPLIESLTDGSWSIVPPPPGDLENSYAVHDVACTSATSCLLVGSHRFTPSCCDSIYDDAWVGHLSNGVFTSGTDVVPDTGFSAVSCADATHCLAVGDGQATLTDQGWSPIPDDGESLTDVSCADPAHCVATDDFAAAGSDPSQLWMFTNTNASPMFGPAREGSTLLTAVSCPTAIHCFAVGSYAPFGGGVRTAILEYLGGRWSVRSGANPGAFSSLADVSCANTARCMAVGSYSNDPLGPQRTLIVEFDNGRWRRIRSPNRGTGSNTLSGVSCTGPARCTAVGWFDDAGQERTLVELFR